MSDFTDYEANDYDESGEDHASSYDNDESWDVDPAFDEKPELLAEDEIEDDWGEEDSGESEEEGEEESSGSQEKVFPNGYTRKQYLDFGFTDNDIATWGLDQNAAPRPAIARKMILDSLDDYLGKDKNQPDQGKNDLSILHW